MLNLYSNFNNIKGTTKASIFAVVAIWFGAFSYLLMISGYDVMAVVFVSICLCITMYLNIYIQSGCKFEQIFINNLPSLLNMVGIVFICFSLVMILFDFTPFYQIFAVTGLLNILAFFLITLNRALKDGQ